MTICMLSPALDQALATATFIMAGKPVERVVELIIRCGEELFSPQNKLVPTGARSTELMLGPKLYDLRSRQQTERVACILELSA